jgi:hypothetical protein
LGDLCRILAIGKRYATREDLGPPAAPKSDLATIHPGDLPVYDNAFFCPGALAPLVVQKTATARQ